MIDAHASIIANGTIDGVDFAFTTAVSAEQKFEGRRTARAAPGAFPPRSAWVLVQPGGAGPTCAATDFRSFAWRKADRARQ
jgi:hypothetical protein